MTNLVVTPSLISDISLLNEELGIKSNIEKLSFEEFISKNSISLFENMNYKFIYDKFVTFAELNKVNFNFTEVYYNIKRVSLFSSDSNWWAIILFPIFQLLVKVNFVYSYTFILSALTINWTISTLGVIISMMSIQTNLGETLIPMLLFPLLVPILIAASNITNSTIHGLGYQYYSFWILICITFSVLTTLVGFWSFKGILQE